MELVYTTQRPSRYLRKHSEWLADGDCLSAVSSQNTIIFTRFVFLHPQDVISYIILTIKIVLSLSFHFHYYQLI